MSPLAQQAGKLCHMSNGQIHVPMVVRSQVGCKVNGPHHSASLYSIGMHLPGIKVVYPGNPYDAKGMIKYALNQPDTVLFCEDKNMYSVREEIPTEEYSVPFNEGVCIREGHDVTVVSIGTMQYKIKKALEEGMIDADIEVVDPRSLYPLNFGIIAQSVKKTGRLVVCEDGYFTCGAGAEIAALVAGDDSLYCCLKAPVIRVSSLDVPHPYSPVLERAMMPTEKTVADAIRRVMG
jgi:pyruvate dehydrogenase E1 component beta subunit